MNDIDDNLTTKMATQTMILDDNDDDFIEQQFHRKRSTNIMKLNSLNHLKFAFDKMMISSKLMLIIFMTICLNLLFLNTAFGLDDEEVCGMIENYMFCNCDDMDTTTEAICFTLNPNLTSDDPYWTRFSKLDKLTRLKISGFNNVSLRHFPTLLFKQDSIKRSLKEVMLSDTSFKTLATDSFHDMKEVRFIEISFCPTMTIERNAFNNLALLEKVVMTKNNIPTLPLMFQNVPMLKELFLEDNHIVNFERDIFVPLKSLTYLTLDKNKIKDIQQSHFNGLDNLSALDMRMNLIEYLPSRVFQKMPKLNRLDLSYNQIANIEEDAFVGLKMLQELRLTNNNLKFIGTQLQSLDNLIDLDLQSNRLEAISKYSIEKPDQKRFVQINIKNNTLFCNCQLFWMKDMFQINPNLIRTHNDPIQMRCYLGPEEGYTKQTILQFLMDNATADKCTIPVPTTPQDVIDSETLPIETIDSIEDFGPTKSDFDDDDVRPNSVEEDFKNKMKEHGKNKNNQQPNLNRAGFVNDQNLQRPSPPTKYGTAKEPNGVQTLSLSTCLQTILTIGFVFNIFHRNF